LDEIKGVGPKTRHELLAHFKTVKAIGEASIDDLTKAVNLKVARAIHAHFEAKK
jgi:excinuclease ABC subunit C